MKESTIPVSREEIEKQYRYMTEIREMNRIFTCETGSRPLGCIRNFGCQMNEHDSEKIAGMLEEMGYELAPWEAHAPETFQLVLFNTCCVRENAEEKVLGHLGALKAAKLLNPELLICVCGCMTEQPHIVETIKKKYKNVDLVFGTQNLHTFPELLLECRRKCIAVYNTEHLEGRVAEGLPIRRADHFKAWVTVMYGCNNFCSYCIVPYVRGRERSRDSRDILREVRALEADGIQEITLLGQNVNSYGQDRSRALSFAELLEAICRETSIPRIRFMTSHPKDLSEDLIQVMADQPQICRQLHLPVQSGSTALLEKMNRHYTAEQYLKLVERLRAKIPDIALSTDVIVGFPGETEKDFQATLDLMAQVRYDMAFTFLYSKRQGTPAARWENQVPEEVAKERFERLLALQNRIDREINETFVGRTVQVLAEGRSRTNPARYTGRTTGNKIVNFTGDRDAAGEIIEVEIHEAATWSLSGKMK